MLEISQRNGSHSNPLVGPRLVSTGCQTEAPSNPISFDTSFKIMQVSSSSAAHLSASTAASESCSVGKPSSASGKNSTCSTSPNDVEKYNSSHFMNGAIIQEDAISPQRPLSSASEEESESSFSEDDEISFNTIKRQVKPASKCDHHPEEEQAVKVVVNNADGDKKHVLNGLNIKEDSSADDTTTITGGLESNIDNNNGHHNNDHQDSSQVLMEDNRCSTTKKMTAASSTTSAAAEAIIEQT